MLTLLFASVLLLFGGHDQALARGQVSYLGCLSNYAASGCPGIGGTSPDPLDRPSAVAVSPDGRSVYVAAAASDAIAVFDRAAGGGLQYAGCVSNTGAGGCADVGGAIANPMDHVASLAVSPDGKSVYAAATTSDAIVVFNRDNEGRLTYAGCVSNTGSGGVCADVGGATSNPLNAPVSVVVSPAGNSVYAAATTSDAIVVFNRDNEGRLFYGGCVSNTGSSGTCGDLGGPATPLDGPFGLAIAPDGSSLYAVAAVSKTVAVMNRDNEGRLFYGGCIGSDGSGGACGIGGPALNEPLAVAVSPDNASLYVTAARPEADAVLAFRRAPGGQLTYASCVDGTGQNQCASVGSIDTLAEPVALAISRDSRSIYVSSVLSDTVAVFGRTPNGRLVYRSCVNDDGTQGCADAGGEGSEPLGGPAAIAVSPDDASLYVASEHSKAVTYFQRNVSPPDTTIVSGPADGAVLVDRRPVFSLASDQPAPTYECSVDDSPFSLCGPSAAIGPLADGRHSLLARAGVDGDLDPTPARRTFTVDTTGPVAKLTKLPPKVRKIKGRQVKIVLGFEAGEPGARFLCSIDGAAAASCASPQSYRLKPGKHRFSVVAVDGLGNAGPPAAADFKLKAKKKGRK